jgi:hypothetical protein
MKPGKVASVRHSGIDSVGYIHHEAWMAKRRSYPTSDDLRGILLRRARAYADREELALSTVGRRVVKDGNLFKGIKEGRNLTFEIYDKVMAFFDDNLVPGNPRRARAR